MMTNNRVTIYDIAQALNLSPSTVSRALSGITLISKDTRDRIFEKARDLGYNRNVITSPVKSKRTGLIGALMPQLNTSFGSGVVGGAEITARQLGYDLVVRQSMHDHEVQTADINGFPKRVKGLLVDSTSFEKSSSLNDLPKIGVPILVIEGFSLTLGHQKRKEGYFEAAYELTTQLIRKGCQRIAYISLGTDHTQHAYAFQGYWQAIRDHGLTQADKFVLVGSDFEKSTDFSSTMLSATPRQDGFLLSNSVMAAFSVPTSGNATTNNQGTLTPMTKDLESENKMILELGRAATWLLISLIEIYDLPVQIRPSNVIQPDENKIQL
jgi:LacI family transcriptional regulator